MLDALNEVFSTAVTARATLILNHMLDSEPVATGRLRPHAGRRLRVQLIDWPDLLPAPPTLCFTITPAGLVEWHPQVVGEGAAAVDLDITVNVSNPAGLLVQGLMGKRPTVSVSGDAALAADVSWVIDNLRWDVRDDLARVFGDLPARELSRSASTLAQGLRSTVQGLVQRARASRDSDSPGGGFDTGARTSSPAQRPAR
ncbi:MAG: hypothetical protein QFE16_07040 [Pseudomonadota bacterium]|nr:hypothetical protein [Pseudomonadota bacterium]